MNKYLHIMLLQILTALILCSTATAGPERVTLAYTPVSTPSGALAAILKRDRILHKALADSDVLMNWVPANKGADSIALMKEGKAEISYVGDMPALEAASSMPISFIALIRQSYVTVVGEQGLIGRDLKGKRIGNAPGTSGHFALLKLLESNGLAERDVTIVPMEVADMPEALLSGRIDAFSGWEPITEIVLSKNANRFAAIGRQKSINFTIVSKAFAERHPDAITHLAAALIRAMNWLKNEKGAPELAADWNLKEIQEFTNTPAQMSRSQMAQAIHREMEAIGYSPRMPHELGRPHSSMDDEFVFLKKMGKIQASASWDQIGSSFDFSIVEQLLKQREKYSLDRFDYERN